MDERKEPTEQTAQSEKELHRGHRERMLQTYLKNGLEGVSDIQILEFLLGYAISRRDTNPIAHRLLDEFGNLNLVLRAPVERLEKVKGMGQRTAAFLHLLPEVWSRCEQIRNAGDRYFRTIPEAGRFLTSRLSLFREERAFLLSLDARCKLLDFRELTRGQVNAVNLPYRKVAEAALMANATSVILAHNHTSGDPMPSMEDISYTAALARILDALGICLTDHIVVSDENFVSMRNSGMLRQADTITDNRP